MRLVLCDDNRIFCEALVPMLQANGHPVLAIATTASDSIAAVAANRPDVCLLDLRFPDGSGLDVARAIRCSVPEKFVPGEAKPPSPEMFRRPTDMEVFASKE